MVNKSQAPARELGLLFFFSNLTVQLEKHHKNCESCRSQVTWKLKFKCQFCPVLSCPVLSCPRQCRYRAALAAKKNVQTYDKITDIESQSNLLACQVKNWTLLRGIYGDLINLTLLCFQWVRFEKLRCVIFDELILNILLRLGLCYKNYDFLMDLIPVACGEAS